MYMPFLNIYFRSWDEPAKKATFDISVYVLRDCTTLSNMQLKKTISDEQNEKYHTVIFQTTPKMSTYLVAVVIGQFEYVENLSQDVLVRIYTPLGMAEQGRFSLECCLNGIEFFQEFFGVSYPLKKYDCVGVPDFISGAMENWGLATFRESLILADSGNSSSGLRQRISITVLHELSHQWFGNLVTMQVSVMLY